MVSPGKAHTEAVELLQKNYPLLAQRCSSGWGTNWYYALELKESVDQMQQLQDYVDGNGAFPGFSNRHLYSLLPNNYQATSYCCGIRRWDTWDSNSNPDNINQGFYVQDTKELESRLEAEHYFQFDTVAGPVFLAVSPQEYTGEDDDDYWRDDDE